MNWKENAIKRKEANIRYLESLLADKDRDTVDTSDSYLKSELNNAYSELDILMHGSETYFE